MFARLAAPALLAAFAAAVPASASVISYEFSGGPDPVICRSPNSVELGVAGNPDFRRCNDNEFIAAPPGSDDPPIRVSADPMVRAPDSNPLGGLNRLSSGIGVGTRGDRFGFPASPGGAAIAGDEALRLSWLGGNRAELTSFAVTSFTPFAQVVRLLDPRDTVIGTFQFVGSRIGRTTVFRLPVPTEASVFRLEPVFTIDSDVGGFYLASVQADVRPIPVPPALPLLGGAVALLVWRSRKGRSTGG